MTSSHGASAEQPAPVTDAALADDRAVPGPAAAGLPSSAVPASSSAEVVRSEERLVPGVERLVRGAVRFGKRVVTEERTVTVTVRREELVLEHLAVEATTGVAGASPREGTGPVATIVLSEEVPEVTVRSVPRETVRLFVDRVTTEQEVTADVAREVVEHDVVTTTPGVAPHDPRG
jgi:uncharacterized protein (TIGR02271 family)